ncbi:MAG: hypothetical protein KF744_00895 [Taibaiella sp.]|nr:hypothetical protein [Taibaiella sp.]
MKRLATLLLAFVSVQVMAQDGRGFLEGMYGRYHGKWRKSLIFTQKTEKYRNDSLLGEETWYETMVYPKNFRIDFGKPDSGNCVIFRNDSAYIFRSHKLMKSRADTNELLYFLGGMYFASSYSEVYEKFRAFGIDPEKSYKRGGVTVLGVADSNAKETQLWIEEKSYNVVRLMRFDNGHRTDARFMHHKKVGKTRCETLVEFYEDGKLRQKEIYTELHANIDIPATMFSVNDPWGWHWAD